MVAVIYINQSILDIMAIASGDLANLDTELFGMIMQLKASASIPGTIVFVALVIYSVKFLLIYFKRLLNLAILTLIAPVIADSIFHRQNKRWKIPILRCMVAKICI